MKQVNIFLGLVVDYKICVTVDCKSDGRREMVESFDKFSRDKKSKKNAMAHKNKT